MINIKKKMQVEKGGSYMSYYSSFYNTEQWTRQAEEFFRNASSQTRWILFGAGFICVLLAVFSFIAWCRIFIRTGLPWERMFVPIYGRYWQYNIADCGWLFWILVACGIFAGFLPALFRSWIPLSVIGAIVLVLQILYLRKLASVFGRGFGFTLGLIFLHPLFIILLGFGKNEFQGPAFVSAAPRPQPRWTCSCGMANPATKAFCINCGKPHP